MPNVQTSKDEFIFVPTGSNFNDLINILDEKNILSNKESFESAAKYMKFANVRAGRYKISNGMNNKSLVSMLRAGRQAAMRMTFSGNIRSNKKIASIASKYIEADSTTIVQHLNDDVFLQKFGVNSATVIELFIPNTYEIYWNTNTDELLERMQKEFNKFWNDDRRAKLKQTGMSQNQAITLASIVCEETNNVAEMPTIAGVYINRINAHMLLQADPTLKFALGDFSIKRILNSHKDFDSPYNTYMYEGLPPSPICMASIAAIDAVLNYEHHDYYYFCAKDDFSGRHAFAKTLAQHNLNADAYHRALNKRNIYK